MRGLHAVCLDCEVVKKDSYTGDSGKVYQLQVQGIGFNHTFRSNQAEQAELWPALGSIVDVECRLEPTRDGSFRMGVPVFHDPVKRLGQDVPANGTAGAKRSAATAGSPS